MAKYICGTCRSLLKKRAFKSNDERKSKTELISYKVLIVKTESHYVCPEGCTLTTVLKG